MNHARWAGELGRLTQRVGQGDRQAFADLYDLTSAYVYGLALTILGTPERAAAATQEIYAEVWQRAARFRPSSGSALAWLMAMAHRQIAEQARAAAEAEPERTPAPVEPDRPHNAHGFWPESERARRALGTLSEHHRQPVTLAYFSGSSQREVARRLGLPVGTVRTRIRDGLHGLRGAIRVGS